MTRERAGLGCARRVGAASADSLGLRLADEDGHGDSHDGDPRRRPGDRDRHPCEADRPQTDCQGRGRGRNLDRRRVKRDGCVELAEIALPRERRVAHIDPWPVVRSSRRVHQPECGLAFASSDERSDVLGHRHRSPQRNRQRPHSTDSIKILCLKFDIRCRGGSRRGSDKRCCRS